MMIKSLLGLLPKMNAIKMLAGMAHGHLGVAMTPVVGCVIHFLSGCMLWCIVCPVVLPSARNGIQPQGHGIRHICLVGYDDSGYAHDGSRSVWHAPGTGRAYRHPDVALGLWCRARCGVW